MGLGTVNLLVNVAGGMNAFAPFKPLHQWNAETWDEIVALNLGYVFLTCRTILRGLLEAKSAGVIVNIASISGETSAPNHAPYGAAKAGLASLTRSLAVEYGGHGIRVNAVAPGAVVTPATANREGAMGTTPLGRHAVAEDIANAVIFLASPLSSFITGQVLLVDGGASSTFPLTTPSDVS
jgi:3-oxoacyl-[acyl-carrier protein] reductase